MTLSQNEIDSLKEVNEVGPYHETQGFNCFGNSSANSFVEKSGLAKDNDSDNESCMSAKRDTVRAVFNPQAMGAQIQTPELTIIHADLGGDIGIVPIAGASPEETAEIVKRIEQTIADGKRMQAEAAAAAKANGETAEAVETPDIVKDLKDNLELASKNTNGHINATYKDQLNDETAFGTECRIDTSAEAVVEATNNPNSHEAGNFAFLKGETPNMSANIDFSFGQG